MAEYQREDDVEEEEEAEKMYVAVSKEIKEIRSILTWALQNSQGKKICTIHVQQSLKKNPELDHIDEYPRMTRISEEPIEEQYFERYDSIELKSILQKEKQQMSAVLDEFHRISRKFKVSMDKLFIQSDNIENGIVQFIELYSIENLVIGAAADKHYSRTMKDGWSEKAVFVKDTAPLFCHISFICNGHLIYTREAIGEYGRRLTPSPSFGNDSVIGNASDDNRDPILLQLVEVQIEAENLRQAAYEEAIRRQKADKEALDDAICKAETAERLYSEELRLREAKEEELEKGYEELITMKDLLSKASDELRKTAAQKRSLENQIEKSNLSQKELLQEYKSKQGELQMERDDALKEVEKLKKQLAEGPSYSDVPVFYSVFSISELENATNYFDLHYKIGEGGYGSIYKGSLRHAEVAIKILHPNSTQGPREFDQEVGILSKLRHPNLVTLIGACPESWALVYEYLPGGNLEDRLTCKDNAPPLPWQSRIRIATELCTALIFLHSSRPGSVIHGDLKPANVLLDGNGVCKLGDFGISRVASNAKASIDGTTFIFTNELKGTIMYMDPVFLSTGEITTKSDVYSFGIILLRLLTGKSALGLAREAVNALSKGTLHNLLDPSAGDWPYAQAEQLTRLALRCSDINRRNRPNLGTDVWKVLEPMKASSQSPFRLVFDNQAPNYFICPINQEVMEDPHIASDGFTYEAKAIRDWLESGHDSSPMTNMTLANYNLTPNRALRSAIQEWLQHNQSG